MTYRSKYRQNKKLIWLYAEYLEQCNTIEEKIKISTEIGRLKQLNNAIKKMPLEDAEKEMIHYDIKVNALL